MSYIINISTAVPGYEIGREDMVRFYSQALSPGETNRFTQKLNFLAKKTKINSRYSCIPDFQGNEFELFTNSGYEPPIERRMAIYKKKIIPLASEAIDKLLEETQVNANEITHLITVTCTGLFAPGLEFLIAEKYGLQHAEKSAVNFLGCYAAMKAIKQAHYISETNPDACVLIVCAELCSLHFFPSEKDEDIISNLLFADGASAVMVCGNRNPHAENKTVLKIDSIGTAAVSGTSGLMSWEVGSAAFRMHLSPAVVNALKENIHSVVDKFVGNKKEETDYWAIHPGGVKIIEVVKESLGLDEQQVADSMQVLQQYGNMSSPTILFILHSIFSKIKEADEMKSKKIFSAAFGPGLNVEMILLSSVNTTMAIHHNPGTTAHAVPA